MDYKRIAKELNEGIGEKRSIPASLQVSYMDRLIEQLTKEKNELRYSTRDLVETNYDIGSEYLHEICRYLQSKTTSFNNFFSELDTTTFCLLSISHFFEGKSGIFPCELALAKFSLKNGVMDSMSMKINPGGLPKGASNEALLHSNETHRFPVPKDHEPEENCFRGMIHFLKDVYNEKSIFFCEGGLDKVPDMKVLINIQRALKKIFEKAGEYSIADELQVVPVSMLFYYLHNYSIKNKEEHVPFQSPAEAHEAFYASNDFEVTTDGCEYHNEIDNKKHCCLSKVRRAGYSLAKFCSQPEKYPLIEGCHYPHGYAA